MPLHQAHRLAAGITHKSAHQAFCGSLALQMLQQRKQGALAGVQADKVHIVEHAWLAQGSQLGVDIAAAQSNAHLRAMCLNALRDTQRTVHSAREGDGEDDQSGLVLLQGCQRQLVQNLVHQIGRLPQGLGQGLKTGLAGRQRLAVAHKFKARVDGIAQHIGQVIEVERRQMTRLVVLP